MRPPRLVAPADAALAAAVMSATLGVDATTPHYLLSAPVDGRHGRASALVRAYELLDLSQSHPRDHEARARLEVARRQQWWDVVFLLHFALLVTSARAEDRAVHLTALEDAASRSGDDALVANLIAVLAAVETERPQELAKAVALLDDLGGSVVHRPCAYVSCFVAYHQRGLWELAEEMLGRAEAALQEPWPPGLAPVATLTSRVVTLNRFEAVVPKVCLLLEVGDRDGARQAAAAAARVGATQTLPAAWQLELAAVDYLLSAVAGDRESRPAHDLLARLDPVRRQYYRAMVILGQSLRHLDAGERGTAAALAETAQLHIDGGLEPVLTPLALYLAAQADGVGSGWQRYAEHQAHQRWAAREQVLTAARAQIAVEHAALDSDRSHRRAYLDELTGLANRHAYIRHLTRLRQGRGAETVAVLMVDIDHFKSVNDDYGHAVGDDVLRRLGAMLLDLTRATDMAVRLGGDEFLLLLAGRSPADVVERAEHLVRQVRESNWSRLVAGLAVTVSAGLAIGSTQDINALLDEADRHLYAAKTGGRARLVHDSAA